MTKLTISPAPATLAAVLELGIFVGMPVRGKDRAPPLSPFWRLNSPAASHSSQFRR